MNTVNPGKPEKGDMSVVQSCSWRRGIKVGGGLGFRMGKGDRVQSDDLLSPVA